MSENNIFTLKARFDTLKRIASELQWMARRYADGRQSYATCKLNSMTRELKEMGVELRETSDKTVWARDAMGREYDGLTDEEAAQGNQVVEWKKWDDEEVEVLRRALSFYANCGTYAEKHEPFAYREYCSFQIFPAPIETDRGKVARDALRGKL